MSLVEIVGKHTRKLLGFRGQVEKQEDTIYPDTLERLLHVLNPEDDTVKDVFEKVGEKYPKNVMIKAFKKVCYGNTVVDVAAAKKIAEALKGNDSISSLLLIRNNIDSRALGCLLPVIRASKTLTHLDLWSNEIGNPGAKAIAKVLITNKTLTSLNINQNRIGLQGANAIAKALTINSTLTALYCSENSLEEESAKLFLKAMKRNSSVVKLSLDVDDIDPELADKIRYLVRRNLGHLEKQYANVLMDDIQSIRAPWMREKIMIVGQKGSGKTTLTRSLVGKEFDDPRYIPTVGANVLKAKSHGAFWRWQLERESEEGVLDFLTDMASRVTSKLPRGQTFIQSMRGKKQQKAMIASRPARSTFQEVSVHASQGSQENSENEEDDDIPLPTGTLPQRVPLSNHRTSPVPVTTSSQETRPNSETESSYSIAAEVKEELNRPFNEKVIMNMRSSPPALKYSLWDFAGHSVAHGMNQMFLTRGIYVVVFSLIEFQSNVAKCTRELFFWLHAIGFHAPDSKIIIAATHLDKVVNPQYTLKVVNKDLRSRLSEASEEVFSLSMLVKNPQTLHLFFPVDNMAGTGVDAIRSVVDREAMKQPHVKREIPMCWVALLDGMKVDPYSFRTPRRRKLSDVREIASKIGIKNDREIDIILDFFHQSGLIVRNPAMPDDVICDPQWLIDSLFAVIREGHLSEQGGLQEMDYEQIKFYDEYLFGAALASKDLMSTLWNPKEIPFLEDFLRQTMHLIPWEFEPPVVMIKDATVEIPSGPLYLVTSLLKNKGARVPYGKRCLFDFSDKFLPDGVFQSLLGLSALEASSSMDDEITAPELYRTWGKIPFRSKAKVGEIQELSESNDSAPIGAFYLVQSTGDKILLIVEEKHSSMAKQIFNLVSELIQQINTQTMNGKLEWTVWFERIHKYISETAAKYFNQAPWYSEMELTNAKDEPVADQNQGSDSKNEVKALLGLEDSDADDDIDHLNEENVRTSGEALDDFLLAEVVRESAADLSS